MNIFYTPDISGIEYKLNEDESRHAVKVLRLGQNEEIILIDGKGTLMKALIVDPNPKMCSVIIKEAIPDYEKRNYKLHIAISPLKNPERFEWFLEKATEIGIDEITPLQCERTEKKNINMERCNRIIESAMKQSINAFHPKMNQLVKLKEFATTTMNSDKVIATCDGDRQSIQSLYTRGSEIVILIGPEGDFSPDEITFAKSNGFIPVTLGNRRLRTETAGIVACHSISFLNLGFDNL